MSKVGVELSKHGRCESERPCFIQAAIVLGMDLRSDTWLEQTASRETMRS